MEKIERYKSITRSNVQNLGERLGGEKDFEVQVITDEEHGHYMVFNNRLAGRAAPHLWLHCPY